MALALARPKLRSGGLLITDNVLWSGRVARPDPDATTHAIVEEDVDLYSGNQSGLNIKAEEAIMGFAFSQAGADAGKLAVGGTFSFFKQDSDTLAHLETGSTVEGGRVDVYAGSLETQINRAGGVAQSKAIGAGVAVAFNDTNRRTRAIIGDLVEDDVLDVDPLRKNQEIFSVL